MYITANPTPSIHPRQLWNLPTPDTPQNCPTITLTAGGAITISSSASTLTSDLYYQPLCTANNDYNDWSSSVISDSRAPFSSSTTPVIYVVAATTVLAWTLILMVFLTSDSNLKQASGGSLNLLPGRGALGAVVGRGSILGSGSRPWLQKVAGSLVAISLTIATADTFKVAEEQYENGWMSGKNMRDDVAGSLEVRVTRVVSDAFLWLAQVQTLIRLFPRHKEKLIIKWIGFLLIILDIVFSAVNSFLVDTQSRPRSYQDAIPALSYTFQLSLSLLYAAWVFYYAATKRRYAFYHYMMPNISIVALLSIVSILIPVVFFVVDIIKPEVGGWGDYFRWVGAAASSIVVWEWVDRIEALEREEKKDGILGREIFDEDDMIDATSTEHSERTSDGDPSGSTLHSRRSGSGRKDFFLPVARAFGFRKKTASASVMTSTEHAEKSEVLGRPEEAQQNKTSIEPGNQRKQGSQPAEHNVPPIDRNQTNSANSTIYTVNYQPMTNTPPPAPLVTQTETAGSIKPPAEGKDNKPKTGKSSSASLAGQGPQKDQARVAQASNPVWNMAVNAFKKRKKSPPLEVKNALSLNEVARGRSGQLTQSRWWQVSTLARIASESHDRQSGNSRRQTSAQVQPTIIPAPPRGQTWSPELQRHSATPGSTAARESTSRVSNPNQVVEPDTRLNQSTATEAAATQINDNGNNNVSSGESTVVPSSDSQNGQPANLTSQQTEDERPSANDTGGSTADQR